MQGSYHQHERILTLLSATAAKKGEEAASLVADYHSWFEQGNDLGFPEQVQTWQQQEPHLLTRAKRALGDEVITGILSDTSLLPASLLPTPGMFVTFYGGSHRYGCVQEANEFFIRVRLLPSDVGTSSTNSDVVWTPGDTKLFRSLPEAFAFDCAAFVGKLVRDLNVGDRVTISGADLQPGEGVEAELAYVATVLAREKVDATHSRLRLRLDPLSFTVDTIALHDSTPLPTLDPPPHEHK